MASSYVRSGEVRPYLVVDFLVSAQVLSNFLKRSYSFSPWVPGTADNFQQRHGHHEVGKSLATSRISMAVTSAVNCVALRKRGTGAHSFVSLLIISAVPTPQFGWQPQESEPHCDSLP